MVISSISAKKTKNEQGNNYLVPLTSYHWTQKKDPDIWQWKSRFWLGTDTKIWWSWTGS